MIRVTFLIFVIMIFGEQVEAITNLFNRQPGDYPSITMVKNFDEFQSKLTTPNVVLIITAQNCPACPPVLKTVVDNCASRSYVKCYWAEIGDYNVANSFYDSKMLNVWWIPYVGFFKDGQKRAAANQINANQNDKNVRAGFRLFWR